MSCYRDLEKESVHRPKQQQRSVECYCSECAGVHDVWNLQINSQLKNGSFSNWGKPDEVTDERGRVSVGVRGNRKSTDGVRRQCLWTEGVRVQSTPVHSRTNRGDCPICSALLWGGGQAQGYQIFTHILMHNFENTIFYKHNFQIIIELENGNTYSFNFFIKKNFF